MMLKTSVVCCNVLINWWLTFFKQTAFSVFVYDCQNRCFSSTLFWVDVTSYLNCRLSPKQPFFLSIIYNLLLSLFLVSTIEGYVLVPESGAFGHFAVFTTGRAKREAENYKFVHEKKEDPAH